MFGDMRIKSRSGDYYVHFGDVSENEIVEWNKDDFFIIDESLDVDRMGQLVADNSIVVEASEELKTLKGVGDLLWQLENKSFKRLVAIGGGTVQDAVSFIASIWKRGIDWVFVPTTLLAQADSCIGGKTSINFGGAKNLLGSFHPPRHVYVDFTWLDTLPDREINSGIGEMLHYFFIEGIELHYDAFHKEFLSERIHQSLQIKKKMIEQDELDKFERRIFNLGHTFGHALEVATEYEVSHGEAVVAGMEMANFVADACGFGAGLRSYQNLMDVYRPLPCLKVNEKKFFEALRKDKKNKNGKINCILANGLGNVFEYSIPFHRINGVLVDYFRARSYELV